MHQGLFKAMCDGRLCVLCAHKFVSIVGQFDHPEFDPVLYAAAFVEHLNELEGQCIDVTDLPHPSQTTEVKNIMRAHGEGSSGGREAPAVVNQDSNPFRHRTVLVAATQKRAASTVEVVKNRMSAVRRPSLSSNSFVPSRLNSVKLGRTS